MLYSLHDASFFTMGDGGEFITLIPGKPLEVEEGMVLNIMNGKGSVFIGTISHVSSNDLGFQIIQAVITSVASGGG